MGRPRTEVTNAHLSALEEVIRAYNGPLRLARFLGVSPSQITYWRNGTGVISLPSAEKITTSPKGENFTVLQLRPDLLRYEKYFK